MEKYNLLVFIAGKQSKMHDSYGQDFFEIKQKYAMSGATLVLVFVGSKANRVIAGQQIGEIEALPPFDDSDGKSDVLHSIGAWIYEAQRNIHSGSAEKVKTAVFVDIPDEVCQQFGIDPIGVLRTLEDTDYYKLTEVDGARIYEQATVSRIAKLKELAKTGDEKAIHELAMAFLTGDGIEKNPSRAQSLLYKAYLRGNIKSIFTLAELPGEPNTHFHEEAAKHGRMESQWLIGKHYYSRYVNDEGTDEDLKKAEHWLDMAAKQGHASAAALLEEVFAMQKM